MLHHVVLKVHFKHASKQVGGSSSCTVRKYDPTVCLNIVILHADAFDPLDPNGNITIKWDVMSWTPDGYLVPLLTPHPLQHCIALLLQIHVPAANEFIRVYFHLVS